MAGCEGVSYFYTTAAKGGTDMSLERLIRIDETKLEVPAGYKQGMRVKGTIYVDHA